jgi:hypothetical protein
MIQSSADYGTNGGVHTLGVAAAGEYADPVCVLHGHVCFTPVLRLASAVLYERFVDQSFLLAERSIHITHKYKRVQLAASIQQMAWLIVSAQAWAGNIIQA